MLKESVSFKDMDPGRITTPSSVHAAEVNAQHKLEPMGYSIVKTEEPKLWVER